VVSPLRPVGIVLCEGKPPIWLGSWSHAPLVMSTASLEAMNLGADCQVKVHHSAMGGLTEWEVTLRLYSRCTLTWTEPLVPLVLPSCVYSVASDTVDLGVMVAKPQT
jgi:hypothetical protein